MVNYEAPPKISTVVYKAKIASEMGYGFRNVCEAFLIRGKLVADRGMISSSCTAVSPTFVSNAGFGHDTMLFGDDAGHSRGMFVVLPSFCTRETSTCFHL